MAEIAKLAPGRASDMQAQSRDLARGVEEFLRPVPAIVDVVVERGERPQIVPARPLDGVRPGSSDRRVYAIVPEIAPDRTIDEYRLVAPGHSVVRDAFPGSVPNSSTRRISVSCKQRVFITPIISPREVRPVIRLPEGFSQRLPGHLACLRHASDQRVPVSSTQRNTSWYDVRIGVDPGVVAPIRYGFERIVEKRIVAVEDQGVVARDEFRFRNSPPRFFPGCSL